MAILPVTLEEWEDGTSKHGISSELTGRPLFAPEVSLAKLMSSISRCAEITVTKLTGNFGYMQFVEEGERVCIALAAWNRESATTR